MNPKFWDDPKQAETILKDLKSHKQWLAQYEAVSDRVDDLEVLAEIFERGRGHRGRSGCPLRCRRGRLR